VRRALAVISVVVALLTGLGACGVNTDHHSINAALVSGKPGFTPARITVSQRDKVVLKVGNRTTAKHGFSILGYPVKETVDPGKTTVVRFTARRAGRFEIYCQLHPKHQHALLVVK
jgi:nitrosocyanin